MKGELKYEDEKGGEKVMYPVAGISEVWAKPYDKHKTTW